MSEMYVRPHTGEFCEKHQRWFNSVVNGEEVGCPWCELGGDYEDPHVRKVHEQVENSLNFCEKHTHSYPPGTKCPFCLLEMPLADAIDLVTKPDMVNHPPHYKSDGGMEAIDVIEAFRLDYLKGNAVKYILRSGRKGDEIEDLKKAVWYLQRRIKALETTHERS
jgi:hypothetical protein